MDRKQSETYLNVMPFFMESIEADIEYQLLVINLFIYAKESIITAHTEGAFSLAVAL